MIKKIEAFTSESICTDTNEYPNNTSQTNVAPWCYKWMDGMGCLGGEVEPKQTIIST